MNDASSLSIGQLATLACTLEVTIPKPGNVHRSADFDDTTLTDFITSAIAVGPAMDAAASRSLGETVLDAVVATRSVVNVNTNLGIVLLLAPLAAIEKVSVDSISNYLQRSTSEDCQKIYQAIAVASPGGLGGVDKHDVHLADPPVHILEAMKLSEEHDMIARQYGSGFAEVIEFVWPSILSQLNAGHSLEDAVIQTHLTTMRRFPDSLIARKNGKKLAQQSAAMAGVVIDAGRVGSGEWLRELSHFDFWLRSDGNKRNPGTTADLIAAALFVGLRLGRVDLRRVFNRRQGE